MWIRWAILCCPVYGDLGRQLKLGAMEMIEPWRSHALSCLAADAFSFTRTLIIIGIESDGSVICSTWVSIPDAHFDMGRNQFAFIQHVNVARDYQKRGLGKQLVEFACSLTATKGVDGILLAAADAGIRERFYERLGFKQFQRDPWLMLRDLKRSGSIEEFRDVKNKATMLRSVSAHDLATVQSICAWPHWECNAGGVHFMPPEECEEEFCDQFLAPEASDKVRGFLVRDEIQKSGFVSWSKSKSAEWTHRIRGENLTEDFVQSLSANLTRRLSMMLCRSTDELRMSQTESLLGSIIGEPNAAQLG
jgi:GNAT superfamily N-acetyltransferase